MSEQKTVINFDEEAYAAAQKYIDNLHEYNSYESTIYSRTLPEEEVISKLVDVAMCKRRIQVENNAFLQKYIVPFEKGEAELTKEMNDFFVSMCIKLRDLTTSEYFDRSVNQRLVRLRSKYCESVGDLAGYIHAVYYIIYFSMVWTDHTGGRERIEGVDILNDIKEEYLNLPVEDTRFSIFDILLASVYEPVDLAGALFRYKRARTYLDKYIPKMYRPDYTKHASYQFATIDTANLSILAYKENPASFSKEDMDYLKELEKYLTTEVETVGINAQQETAIITLYELRYIVGIYTIEELLDKFMELFSAAPVEGRINKSAQLLKVAAQYVEDLWLYSPLGKQEKYDISNDLYLRVMLGYELTLEERDEYFDVVNLSDFISNCSKYMGFERTGEWVLMTTVRADKALYIHTKMVRHIAMIIAEDILHDDPVYFDGVAGYDANFISKHPTVLMELISQCASYHDIGKFYCLDYVANSSRNLTDDEFKAIKYHPENFDRFFSNERDEEFQCIRDAARLHHLWHNGKGGYPMNLSHTKNLPIVDILSIADSIDAATDIIGRPYTSGKTLDQLIEEFDTFRDTRYSAYVVDVLKRPEIKKRIENAITTDRKHINFEILTR